MELGNNNFLEKLTLGELFYFLFDNNEFITEAKSKTTSITNDIDRTATKAELIAIIDAIEELKPKLKEVIMLCEIYGYKYEEAAKKLNCPVGTIKSRIYNAKKELAEKLEDLL